MNRLKRETVMLAACTLVGIAVMAYVLIDWNTQRIACEGRGGVLARGVTGWVCVAQLDIKGVLPISNGGPGAAPKYPNCKVDKFLDGNYPCTTFVWSNSCKVGQFLTGSGGCEWPELTEFVPDSPVHLFRAHGAIIDCTYSGPATALRNRRENECIQSLMQAYGVSP